MNMKYENEYERAKIFSDRQVKVHIKTKDGIYRNGIIKEVMSNYFIIYDEDPHKTIAEPKVIMFDELDSTISEFVGVKK